MDFDKYLLERQEWRATGPVFDEPHGLYERPRWYDFLVKKDRLFLIRGVLAQLPIGGLNPPRELFLMCLNCATSVIELYADMFNSGHITWTRSYFQILFTSGLSIMYAESVFDIVYSKHTTRLSVESWVICPCFLQSNVVAKACHQ